MNSPIQILLKVLKNFPAFCYHFLVFLFFYFFFRFLKPWININRNEWARRPRYDVWMQCPLCSVNAAIENYRLRTESHSTSSNEGFNNIVFTMNRIDLSSDCNQLWQISKLYSSFPLRMTHYSGVDKRIATITSTLFLNV